MRICVIGLGYIGLPTASMFAIAGHEVVGVDINKQIIELINNGNTHINEPGIKQIVKEAILLKKLVVSNKPEPSDTFIICVPTPLRNKSANLDYVKSAAKSIVPYLSKGNLVILESTVSPTTTMEILIPLLEKSNFKAGEELYIAHCPERVIPGNIIKEIVQNDRIIGGINRTSAKMAQNLYKSFVKGDIFLTDLTTAEMIKLMENTYRDVNIALANEFASLCEGFDINVWEAIEFANKHPRVNIHQPGPGVGGHCIPIDPWFIVQAAPNGLGLIELSRNINNNMAQHVVKSIEGLIGNLNTNTVTIFGAAYKGNVEDTRETPTERIIEILISNGCNVKVHDPLVRTFKYNLTSMNESVTDSNCIVVLTDHDKFKNIDRKAIEKISSLMHSKNILDTRNCINHNIWKNAGFNIKLLGSMRLYI